MLPCFCPWEELAGGEKAERVIFSPASFWLCLWHQSQQQHKATLGCCSNCGIRPSLTGRGFKSTHSTHMQMVGHVSFWDSVSNGSLFSRSVVGPAAAVPQAHRPEMWVHEFQQGVFKDSGLWDWSLDQTGSWNYFETRSAAGMERKRMSDLKLEGSEP